MLFRSQAGDLTKLEPNPHAVLKPPAYDVNALWSNYGAMEFTINISTNAGVSLNYPGIRVLLDDLSVNTSSAHNFDWKLVNGSELKLYITSPSGGLKYYDPRVSIVLNSTNFFASQPALVSVEYYDINGNKITGPTVDSYTISVY